MKAAQNSVEAGKNRDVAVPTRLEVLWGFGLPTVKRRANRCCACGAVHTYVVARG